MTRLGTLKAKARTLNSERGVVPTDVAVANSGIKRNRVTKKANGDAPNKKIKKESVKVEENDGDKADGTRIQYGHDHAVTPPATPVKKAPTTSTGSSKLATPSPKAGNGATNGNVQSKRCSPRHSAKPDYRKLDDPFVYMGRGVGGDEANVFGQDEDSESVESVDSDTDFDGEAISAPL